MRETKILVSYNSPTEWLKNNRKILAKYAGEWIAFDQNGIIVHNKSGKIVAREAREIQADFVLKYVHPLEIPRVVRIFPIRVRSLKNKNWLPEYLVELTSSSANEKLSMLVDSGADITIIPKWTGEDLGLKLSPDEYVETAEGVNGSVSYVVRNLTFKIDEHIFKAPVGWILTEEVEDILLGREVVFDLFDVEFKQSDEVILFKWRTENKSL